MRDRGWWAIVVFMEVLWGAKRRRPAASPALAHCDGLVNKLLAGLRTREGAVLLDPKGIRSWLLLPGRLPRLMAQWLR